uniref:RRM domain-containing protein n=1 Tax=Timema cristinae TaxID=61476 RepID=A0A7R9CT01_TIMCR|nr:unnamed protein product [Timema cristinae]
MSRYRDSGSSECKLYVGDLDRGGRSSGSAASKQELEEAFSYYGPLRNVWVARNPPGFAFVEFEDPRDAEDAVRGLDAQFVAVVCEWSRPMEWVERAADSVVRHLAGGDLFTLRIVAMSVVNGDTMPGTATATAAVEVVVEGPILVQGQGHALEIVARVLAQPPVHGPGTGAALSHVHPETGPEHLKTGQGLAVLVYAPAPETALAQPTPTAAQRPVRGAVACNLQLALQQMECALVVSMLILAWFQRGLRNLITSRWSEITQLPRICLFHQTP